MPPILLSVCVKNNKILNHLLYLIVKMIFNTLIILKKLLLLRLQSKRKGNIPQKKEKFLEGITVLIAWKREALLRMVN